MTQHFLLLSEIIHITRDDQNQKKAPLLESAKQEGPILSEGNFQKKICVFAFSDPYCLKSCEKRVKREQKTFFN